MRALSIRQPWAWAIVTGRKRVENRTWRTNNPPGPLLVHAPKTHDEADLRDAGVVLPPQSEMPRGVIVGGMDVAGFHWAGSRECDADEYGCDLWGEPDCWHWEIADAWRLDRPIAATGALGLWQVSREVAEHCRARGPEEWTVAEWADLTKALEQLAEEDPAVAAAGRRLDEVTRQIVEQHDEERPDLLGALERSVDKARARRAEGNES